MPKHNTAKNAPPPIVVIKFDPLECPFREFKDNELSNDYWGMGPAALRNAMFIPKAGGKQALMTGTLQVMWEDEQTQPLPNSVRHYLDAWVPAEELARRRWDAEVVVFDENSVSPMSVIDFQLSHTQVLLRSSFCRQVLSACFNLERAEGLQVEHTWENFNFVFGPEGWRARYHIYSPGMKAGGGAQHRPTLSKNGCYLVRLFYLGAWRCVWVSDQVPVDAGGSPLLPFTPISSPSPNKVKGISTLLASPYVHLWPMLLCKALLKIAAPDTTCSEEEVHGEEDETTIVEDEDMPDFDIIHALTGGLSLMYPTNDPEALWQLLQSEVRAYAWDDDYDDAGSSTIKSRSTKKPNPKDKDKEAKQKGGTVTTFMQDTKELPTYVLPGISPALEMVLIVTMVRDIPLKRPLPEPEVALWKHHRWIDWARRHGLYEAYECPRTRYLKVNGLMKLSYAPHLLDVQSTESITRGFREEQQIEKKKNPKDQPKQLPPSSQTLLQLQQLKEELREWMLFESIHPYLSYINIVYHPSLFEFTSAASNPPMRTTRVPNRNLDIQSPKAAPLYLQIDNPEKNTLRISLSMVHPKILANNGFLIDEYVEKAYVLLEHFKWFKDEELPLAKAYVQTRGYGAVEVTFPPGRHFCRMWVHSCMNWHAALLSESRLVLGTRDVIQAAACLECPWVTRFLNVLGTAFSNWIRLPRSLVNFSYSDREFYSSYQPDLDWDPEVIGYEKPFVHWMFRQAVQSYLYKRLQPPEYQAVCAVLRKYFLDPDIGFPPKPKPATSLREIMERDPCDCPLPEVECMEEEDRPEEQEKEPRAPETEEEQVKVVVSECTMADLLKEPDGIDHTSQLCKHASQAAPCAVLRVEREKMIRMHEAATCIQAHWRGSFVRKCLKHHVFITPDVIKLLMDNSFGNLDVLSQLMNEFFFLFPEIKEAYSVSSALKGIYGIQQHNGTCPVTAKCKWIPYFQGVFYCHMPVKVHFDVNSSIEHSTVQIYDNDTGEICPQAYNAHITFDIHPNVYGYTVLGHGSYNQPLGHNSEVHWQLTVMTSTDHVFHVCENFLDSDTCTILPLTPASKLHIDEFYLPNRRNILGGIQISVSRVEAVSFRAAATTPDLKIEAILRTTHPDGEVAEVARCHGKGEIFWPYIRLEPALSNSESTMKKMSLSSSNLTAISRSQFSAKGMKGKSKDKKGVALSKSLARSMRHEKTLNAPAASLPTHTVTLTQTPQESKTYTIQVIAPDSWALPIQQWKTIAEAQQDVEIPKYEMAAKKPGKEKAGSAKDKKKDVEISVKDDKPLFNIREPQPDDAHIEIECSTTVGGGAYARRDDERDVLFATALRSWDMKEPGRNARGAQLRQEFRDEFLAIEGPQSKSDSLYELLEMEGDNEINQMLPQGPSPVTESGLMESVEMEEEMHYYLMPERLKDKFIPLTFVPECARDISGEPPVIVTDDIIEAAKIERALHLEAAIQRMHQLQEWNVTHVLGRQAYRNRLLEKLLIDGQWGPELAAVMEQRNEAIAQEQLERQQSAIKKKQAAVQSKAESRKK